MIKIIPFSSFFSCNPHQRTCSYVHWWEIERERHWSERNINWLPLELVPTRNQTRPRYVPCWGLSWPFGVQDDTPTEPHQPGPFLLVLEIHFIVVHPQLHNQALHRQDVRKPKELLAYFLTFLVILRKNHGKSVICKAQLAERKLMCLVAFFSHATVNAESRICKQIIGTYREL